jgi:YHS domain-containing protein
MAKLILWGILIVILIRALMRLTRGVLRSAGYTRQGGQPKSVGLVRDPVCGVFVAPSQALTAGSGTDARFFCSEKCRREWTAR